MAIDIVSRTWCNGAWAYYQRIKDGKVTHKIWVSKYYQRIKVETMGFLWDSEKEYDYETVPKMFQHLRIEKLMPQKLRSQS